jgi:hypothetical protein
MSQRVTTDRLQHAGIAGKAAANGCDVSAAVFSQSDYERVVALGDRTNRERTARDERTEARGTRKQASQARSAEWSGTIDGLRKHKIDALFTARDQAEQRRRRIDEEESSLRALQHKAQTDAAEEALRRRDERVLELNSRILLDSVLKERDEQLVVSARRREAVKQRDAHHDAELLDAARRTETAEQAKAAAAKQRTLETKAACVAQMHAQISQRQAQRDAAVEEGVRIRTDAEKAAKEDVLEKQQRREEARELAQHHLAQASLSPKSKLSTHSSRGAVAVEVDHTLDSYAETKQLQVEALKARESQRQAEHHERIAAATKALELSPRREVPPIALGGVSMNERMLCDDAGRVSARREARSQYTGALDSQVARTMTKRSTRAAPGDVQERIRARAHELAEEEHEERVLARQDALRLQHVHEMQTRQKHARDDLHRRLEIDDGIAQIQSLRAEDAAMDAFLASQAAVLSPRVRDNFLRASPQRVHTM